MTPATSERWNAIEELYVLLEGLPAEERERQLDSHAPELAAAVRELFASIENEEAAQGRLAAEARQSAPFAPPVPGYELLDPIGSGGAGAVYRGQRLIDQGSPQPVAVKVFHSHRAGLVDRQRFVRELRIVAALDHPAIVKFFDGGFTPEGRPFLVMEMVEGLPVTAHCETRQLDLEERIRLLLAIFDAIAWAHARFVVHLDLKPSNILVTAHGTPKVLDFGAARLLDFAGDLTVTQQITPQYASPERLRGEAPTVASDVYSLGLLMFEVLSGGGWPFSSRDSILGLAERAVNKDALTPLPDAAGRLAFRARLRGDLDAICTKALAFDSGERYETVSDLAADLRRVLTGEPVQARANNLLYRVRKFTARHLIRLTIAAVFVLGLGAAALYSAIQARQARRSAEQARRSVAALEQLLSESNYGRSSGGRDMTVKELLATGSARIAPTLVSDPALGADFALVLTSGFVAQADYAHARVTADQAVQLARASADDVRSALALAASSTVSYHENRPDAAWNEAQRAVALWQSNRRAFSPERSLAVLMAAGSILLYSKPSDPAAGEVYEACLRIAPQASQERATCLEGFSNSLIYSRSSYREALPLLEEALTIRRGGAIINPLALAVLLQTYGMANRFVDHYREDEAAQREALALTTGALGPGALQTANFRAVWASSLAGVGRAKEGLAEAEGALAVYRLQFKERGSNLLWTPLSAAMTNACLVERFADCERYAREAAETLGRNPSPKDSRLLSAHGHLGWALAHLGKQQDAQVLLSETIAAYHQQNRRPLAMSHLEAALKAIREQ